MSKTTTAEFSTTRKRQSLLPGNIQITKTPVNTRQSFGGGMVGMTGGRRSVMSSSYSAPVRASGEAVRASKDAVTSVLQGRGKEKKDIGHLNERFASYIESVKYMEAQIKMLTACLEKCRKDKGYDQDRVKKEYEDELTEARCTIAAMQKDVSPLQAKNLALEDKIETLEAELEAMRKQRDDAMDSMQKMSQMQGDLEGECATLRRQCELGCKEIEQLKEEVQRLRADNDRIRNDFEVAVMKQINAETQCEALTEELAFVTDATECEITELRCLLKGLNTMPDLKADFQSSFKSAVAALQDEFQCQLRTVTDQQQMRYDEQLHSMRNSRRDAPDTTAIKQETKTLKSSLDDSRKRMMDLERENSNLIAQLQQLQKRFDDECEECEQEKGELRATINELQMEIDEVTACLNEMRDHKLDLELEIACYRKLLEGEENSMKKIVMGSGQVQTTGGTALASMIGGGGGSGGGGGGGGGSSSSQQSTMSESTGTVRVTRSSKCVITIAEAAQDGSCVRLENSSKTKDFDLGGWALERSHPKGTSSFTFPKGFKLGSSKSVKIYGNVFYDDMHTDKDDLKGDVKNCKSWGVGNGGFKLKNEAAEEKASSSITYN